VSSMEGADVHAGDFHADALLEPTEYMAPRAGRAREMPLNLLPTRFRACIRSLSMLLAAEFPAVVMKIATSLDTSWYKRDTRVLRGCNSEPGRRCGPD
jgi:hypothetical protein